MTSGGFVRLGISRWEADNAYGGGVPQKQFAMAYAHAIGADAVSYAVHVATDKDNYTAHEVTFYAKQGVRPATPASTARPGNAEASVAMNRLQDALGKPHVKGGGSQERHLQLDRPETREAYVVTSQRISE